MQSNEPLDEVITDLVGVLDRLAGPDLGELLSAIGRRHQRERTGGWIRPNSSDGQR